MEMLGIGEVPFYDPSDEAKNKRMVLIGVAIAVLIAILGAIATCTGSIGSTSFQVHSSATDNAANSSSGEPIQDSSASIYVHVLGSVKEPGVYALPESARVFEAINAAGGFAEDAHEEGINLASVLKDGDQVKVLSADEALSSASGNEAGSPSVGAQSNNGIDATSGKVNINTATVDQLKTLNGVGDSTAQKIVAYREKQGRFASIEDLMNVSGIGQKKFDAIKDSITV